MLVLDTNVIAELMRPVPSATVIAWLSAQPASAVWTTALSRAELLHGIALLPEGKRQGALSTAARDIFELVFKERVLAFTTDAAPHWADICAGRARGGRPVSAVDAQIAAIARVVGGAVVTRNVYDFGGCGVDVVNPWDA